MCRLFGFRSNQPVSVHRSLVAERNSLQIQSREHPDGWGIAYYRGSAPELVHGIGPAHADPEFTRWSQLLSSHAVVAHVRLASVGEVALKNAHPFAFQNWSFAHNGTIRQFETLRPQIEAGIDPQYRTLIRSDTDSERCFYLILSILMRTHPDLSRISTRDLAQALARAMAFLIALGDPTEEKPSGMNFLLTDGERMVASRHCKSLFYAKEPGDHVVIASEQLCSERAWCEVGEDEIIGVDAKLQLDHWSMAELLSEASVASAPTMLG